MFQNFLKITLRNLLKHRTFSVINLLGLTVGLTSFLLIALWIRDETSYDRFHEYSDRLYRVMENQALSNGEILTQAEAPGLLGEALKTEVPELAYATTMDWWTNTLVSYENQSVKEEGRYVGEDFLKMFSFPLLHGNKETALTKPNSIVISQRLAEKLFPGADPMGKLLKIANFTEVQVTGVMADLPKNSVFKFEFLLPYSDFIGRNAWARSWENNGLHTWVMLDEGADVQAVNQKIKDFVSSRGEQDNVELFLQPLTDVYLKTDFKNGTYQGGGRIAYLRLFGIIALLVLLIACVNFMNLSTARATVRAKEVGVRKVVGAGRRLLTAQFIGEATLMCWLALGLSLAAVDLVLPWFNTFTGKSVAVPYHEAATWLVLAGITTLTALLAGAYPAFVISAFRPAAVLKGGEGSPFRGQGGGVFLRRVLVAGQFSIAVFLIIGTLTVWRQMDFLQTKNLGYDKAQLLGVAMNHEIQGKFDAFKSDLLRTPGVVAVTASHSRLTGYLNASDEFEWEGKSPGDKVNFVWETVGHDYLSTIGATLLEGRDFSPEHADSANFIVNETAIKRMGLTPPYTGQRLKAWGKEGQIIGVTKDFHFRSLREQVEPLVLTMSNPYVWTAYVRLDGKQVPESLRQIEALCKKYSPTYPFEYAFADDAYNELYKSEQVVGSLASVFAFLAVFISCLGLFGLATFATERRVKEIGIRKVLGASVAGIVALLSKDFLKLVIWSLVIASPLAWYFMDKWLADFAYRIDIHWTVFAVAGLAAVAVAFLTVGFQSVKAALADPVKSLRSE